MEQATNAPARPVILVVDDEPQILQIAAVSLRPIYSVLTAGGGEEALRIADQYSGCIDLVLTDLHMADLNGLELRARLIERHPETIVAVLSGDTFSGEIPQGVPAIQKPFTISGLRQSVHDLLAGTAAMGARSK